MPPLLLRVFSGHLRWIGRGSGWQLDPLATLTHRRYKLLGGGPINHPVGHCSGHPSRRHRLPLLSTRHLRSRCSPSRLRDSRSHLVRDSGTSLVLVSSVARMATMPGSVLSSRQLSHLSRLQILGLLIRLSSRERCPVDLVRCTSRMLSRLCSRRQLWLVCLPSNLIQLWCCLILVHRIPL